LKLRISLVDFLNAAPLGWSFLHGPHRELFDVVLSTPAGCADQLASGKVDIGIIPSIEYQRTPGLQIIPGIGIAASHRVRSVILLKNGSKPIRSVALDTSSRTSVALIRLLLEMRDGLHPEYIHHAPDPGIMMRRCDAALLIGDRALQVDPEEYEYLDLAEEWVRWQNLPFVFAVWACRAGIDFPPGLVGIFHEALAWGWSARKDIVASFSDRLGIPTEFLDNYLLYNIDYRLNESYWKGLEMFHGLAYSVGLVPELRAIHYAGASSGGEASPSNSTFQ
jgi:chorismate dehydratase